MMGVIMIGLCENLGVSPFIQYCNCICNLTVVNPLQAIYTCGVPLLTFFEPLQITCFIIRPTSSYLHLFLPPPPNYVRYARTQQMVSDK